MKKFEKADIQRVQKLKNAYENSLKEISEIENAIQDYKDGILKYTKKLEAIHKDFESLVKDEIKISKQLKIKYGEDVSLMHLITNI